MWRPSSCCCLDVHAYKPNVHVDEVPNADYVDNNNELPGPPEPALILNDNRHGEEIHWEDARTLVLDIHNEDFFGRVLRNFPPGLTHITYLIIVMKFNCSFLDNNIAMKRFVEQSLPNLEAVEIRCHGIDLRNTGWDLIALALTCAKKLDMVKLFTSFPHACSRNYTT